MHDLMITNSRQYFTGLNKCRTVGEKNIQDMVTSSGDIDSLKKAIVFDYVQYNITQNGWIIVACDSVSFPVDIRQIQVTSYLHVRR